MQMKLMWN